MVAPPSPSSSTDDAESSTDGGGGLGLGLPPSLRAEGKPNEDFDLSSLPRLGSTPNDDGLDGMRPVGAAVGRPSQPDRGMGRALVLFLLALVFIGGLLAAWYVLSTDSALVKNVFGTSENTASGGVFRPIPGRDDLGNHDDDDDAHHDGTSASPQLETYAPGRLGPAPLNNGETQTAQPGTPDSETTAPATEPPPQAETAKAALPTAQKAGVVSETSTAGATTSTTGATTDPAGPARTPSGGTDGSAAGNTAAGNSGPVSRPILVARTGASTVDVPDVPLENGSRPSRMPRYADLPPSNNATALPQAPIADLIELTDRGRLPTISTSGQTPWQAYSRPFSGTPRAPKVAIVITGLGQKTSAMEAVIGRLPAEVTLAFQPYGNDLDTWMQRARDGGHETMIEMIVEPAIGGQTDPGPLALLSTLSASENIDRLRSQMAAGTGYVGLIAPFASRFTDSSASLRPILGELKARGLIYIHNGNIAAVNDNADVSPPVNQVTSVLDNPPFQRAIDLRLQALEKTATENGYAIGVMGASPLTLTRLTAWINDARTRGVEIAPLSAVVLTP